MIKTILVPAISNESDIVSLAAVLQVARAFAAHLDVHVKPNAVGAAVALAGDVGVGTGGALTASVIEQLEEEADDREASAHLAFSEFCAREGLTLGASPTRATARPSAEWHVETGQDPRLMVAYGMSARFDHRLAREW